MGRVYTPEGIANEDYPQSKAAHQAAVHEIFAGIKQWSREYSSEKNILEIPEPPAQYMVYGSVANGSANRRSDLDFLALNGSDRRSSAYSQRLKGILREAGENNGVYVEPNLYSIRDLIGGRHFIDPFFWVHLHTAEQNEDYSTGWPASTIASFIDTDPSVAYGSSVVNKYLAAKKSNFNQLDSFDEGLLQRAFELPKAIGRKVVQLSLLTSHGLYHPEDLGIINLDDEEYLQIKFTSLFRRFGIIPPKGEQTGINPEQAYHGLQKKDQTYSEVLEAVINGDITLDDYGQRLRGVYPEAINEALALTIGAISVADQLAPDIEEAELPENVVAEFPQAVSGY